MKSRLLSIVWPRRFFALLNSPLRFAQLFSALLNYSGALLNFLPKLLHTTTIPPPFSINPQKIFQISFLTPLIEKKISVERCKILRNCANFRELVFAQSPDTLFSECVSVENELTSGAFLNSLRP